MSNNPQLEREISTLRTRARNVHLSDSVKETVMSEARARYDASLQEVSAPQLFDANAAPRSLSRRTFVRVTAVAAAAGTTFLGLSILGQPTGEDQQTSPLTSNSFVLIAYADAIQEGDAALLTTDDFVTLGGDWSEGDNGLFRRGHAFNLSCTGNGIRSVVYSLEGDLARVDRELPASDTSTGVSTACVFFNPDAVRQDDSNEQDRTYLGDVTSFDAQPTTGTSASAGSSAGATSTQVTTQAALIVRLIAPDDLSAALNDVSARSEMLSNDSYDADNYRTYLEATDRVTLAAEALYAEAVSQTTLVVTATFDNGSTQTQRYHIAPIDDLAAVYGSYLANCTEAAVQLHASGHGDDAQSPERTQYEAVLANAPRLYTITREE